MRKSGGIEGVQSRGGAVVVVVVGMVVVVVVAGASAPAVVEGSARVVEGSAPVVGGAPAPAVVEGSVVVEGVETAGASSSEIAVPEQDSKTSRPTATGRNGRGEPAIPITGRKARARRFAGGQHRSHQVLGSCQTQLESSQHPPRMCPTGCGAAWQRACFGSRRSSVRIRPARQATRVFGEAYIGAAPEPVISSRC